MFEYRSDVSCFKFTMEEYEPFDSISLMFWLVVFFNYRNILLLVSLLLSISTASGSIRISIYPWAWVYEVAMERTVLLFLKLVTFLALSLASVTFSSASEKVISASKLKMFVDELPDMPRILGYKVVNGVPKSKSLNIGMFKKKWVCPSFCFFSITNLFCFAGFDNC